jgi:putative lipase involved disintegration of autophagic bodies
MSNSWIEHVKKYAQDNNVSYRDAMKLSKDSYQNMSGGSLSAQQTKDLLNSSYNKKNKDYGDFKIDKKLSGKRTKVYYNEKEDMPVVVHRGTASIQDVGTDIGLAFGHRGDRFKHAKKIQKKAEKKYGADNMATIGHSLGGILAEEVGGNSKNVITLNKAVTPWELNRKNGENQTDIKTENDPVSMLNHFSKNKASVIKSDGWNPLAEHTVDVLDRVDPNKIYGSGMPAICEHCGKCQHCGQLN